MKLTLRQKYIFAVGGISALFSLNALWLYSVRNDKGLHSSSFYPGYAALRTLLLQPGSIITIAVGLAIWFGLVYWRSRSRPLSDRQKVALACVLLATVYGYVLTACFRL
jgi:hypothetical protein